MTVVLLVCIGLLQVLDLAHKVVFYQVHTACNAITPGVAHANQQL